MRRLNYLALAVAMAFGWASQAPAESLDLEEMAAALALPVITGGYPGNAIKGTTGDIIPNDSAVTINTVTNGSMSPILLRIDVISGDPRLTGAGQPYDADNWQSTSFDCPLTGRETVAFLFMANGQGSTVFAECAGLPITRFLNTENGIQFIGVADPASGAVVSQDLVFGDSIVIQTANGGAFSVGAVPFQAGGGANDGNKVYAFDGVEYAQFPALVATNFIAPTVSVVAELILFTLDGTVGQVPPPRVRLTGLGYNDDELPFDFQYEFECFDIVQLQDIDPNFFASFPGMPGLGSFVGHLQLRAQPIGRGNFDAHDARFGDGNNIRTTPVAGWIAQAVVGGGVQTVLLPGALTAPVPHPAVTTQTPVAWGRPLAVSRTAAMPFLGDDAATLDAQP